MNIFAIKADGDYCPIESCANGQLSILDPSFVYVPSDETDISKTFAREIARMRSPYYESAYDEITQTDWLEIGGFK